MPRFRKKPVVIEAVQLRWDNWAEMCNGVITSWNDKYVFVRYDGDKISKATNPSYLDWLPQL